MTRYLLSTIAIISLASCQTFKIQQFNSDYELADRLPPLEVEFDVLSFAPDYDDIYNIPNVILTGGTNVEQAVKDVTIELTISQDTKLIFEREIKTKISDSRGPVAGYAVCRKGLRSNGIKSYLHPVVSVFTLGVANLFGFPVAYMKDELEIIVEIYDNDDELVGRYAGFGYGEGKQGLYSGYSRRDAKRTAHAEAFTNAMVEVKDQIAKDRIELRGLLVGS